MVRVRMRQDLPHVGDRRRWHASIQQATRRYTRLVPGQPLRQHASQPLAVCQAERVGAEVGIVGDRPAAERAGEPAELAVVAHR